MMLVSQAKDIVRQWVSAEASHSAGFRGAFFHGSINWLAEDDLLPPTSDVDVMLVLEGPLPPGRPGKFLRQGLIIEASYLPADELRSAEQVLGISHLAGSLRAASLIADPSGQLSRVQAGVCKGYARRKWVLRRCDHARRKVLGHLQGLNEGEPFHDQVNHWLFGAGVTTHILLVAGLKNPTVRKRYLAVRELLAEYGRSDFYAALLELLGCAQLSQARAEQHLAALAAAFDAASAVIHSPFPFAADISDLARPVAIDGSRELIARGDQREAAFWMAATYSRCQGVLLHDAPPDLQARHTPGYRAFLADLGITSLADLQRRSQEVRDMLPRVAAVAQDILAANPAVERD